MEKIRYEREALTRWRVHREGIVRTWKGREIARGTHVLENAEGWTSQDMDRKRTNDGHSRPGEHREMDSSDMERRRAGKGHLPTGEHRGMDKFGHGKEARGRGPLTLWRTQMDGLIRTGKGSE